MAHGKETPRQKMIGMMYLVLMAMLALNVSNEVLKTFDVLDEGLRKTIITLEATNSKVLSDFNMQYELNPAKVESWKNKAEVVSQKADAIVEFLQAKKIEILEFAKESEALEAAGESKQIDSKLIKGKDKTDAPAYVMIGDNNDKGGREVKEMMEDFRNYLVAEIVNTEAATPIRSSIESSLNTEIEHKEGDTEIHTWESTHFEHLPLSGVLTIMQGLQINVRNAESEALKYLYGQIDAGSFKFNQLNANVIPNSSYIIRGNDYRAEVFLAASDTTASPVIYVTEDPRPYDSVLNEGAWSYIRRPGVRYDSLNIENSGKGIYSTKPGSLGTRKWGGFIKLVGPTGTITKPFKRSYMVAESSITVAPTKMNVFYLGVENPVEVSVAGVQPDKIDISVTNGRHVKKGDTYFINAIRPGNSFVVVYAEIDGVRREMGRREFRVKTVPNPMTTVNGQTGGIINQQLLAAQIGVQADMGPDFDFDLKFTVTEFTVSATVQGFQRSYTSKSNRFNSEQKNLINSLSRGNNVYIEDVKAVGPDGSTRNLAPIKFKLN